MSVNRHKPDVDYCPAVERQQHQATVVVVSEHCCSVERLDEIRLAKSRQQ
jgi:hypothetical protein